MRESGQGRREARKRNCMYSARTIFIAAAITVISGCSSIGGGNGLFGIGGDEGLLGIGGDPETYRDARIMPSMEIPPELDSYTIDALYVIPESPVISGVTFDDEIPLPKPIETRRREGVVIQNLGDRRWIVIDATPAQVWPLVRDFWAQLNLELDVANPGDGFMETAWLEVGNAPETRQKYRVVVEPGLHSGSSEITVRHIQDLRTQPIPILVEWPEASDNLEMEQQILTAVSQYLADRNDIYQASTASLLAGTIEGARKANLIDNAGGSPYLQLRIDYDRAWVQVRQALNNADIEIVDSDRDGSVFNVRFAGLIQELPEPGFVRRLFGASRQQQELVFRDFTVRLQRNGDSIDVTSDALEELEEATQLNRELLQVIIENLV